MRSTYYPGVCTKPGTYYQGWFMYMKYTQGQNEEYLLSDINWLEKLIRSLQLSELALVCTLWLHW